MINSSLVTLSDGNQLGDRTLKTTSRLSILKRPRKTRDSGGYLEPVSGHLMYVNSDFSSNHLFKRNIFRSRIWRDGYKSRFFSSFLLALPAVFHICV